MGVLSLTTTDKVREFSTLPEVNGMEDNTKLQRFIDRAEYMASRWFDYDSTLPAYAAMMEIALDMLVENLVVMSTPSFKRSAVGKLRAEQIGSYSYSRSDNPKGPTTPVYLTDEIWQILNSYKAGTDAHMTIETVHVFLPRTIAVDNSGHKYYLPETIETDPQFRDPPNPQSPLVPWFP